MKVLLHVKGDDGIAQILQQAIQNDDRAVTVSPYMSMSSGNFSAFADMVSNHDVLVTQAGRAAGQTYDSLRSNLRKLRDAGVTTKIVVFTDDDPLEEAMLLVGGADYCVGEPTMQAEERIFLIRAAVDRVVMRHGTAYETEENEIRIGGLHLNTNTCLLTAVSRDALVRLTVTETKILETLMRRPSAAYSRDQLLSAAYPDDVYVDDRTIDSHIKRIRLNKLRKLNDGADKCIMTLYGVGYRFSEDVARKLFPIA